MQVTTTMGAAKRETLDKLLLGGWALCPIPILLVAVDLVARHDVWPSWGVWHWLAYGLAECAALVGWWLLFLVTWRVSRWNRYLPFVPLLPLTALTVTWLMTCVPYYHEFGMYPTSSDIQFFFEEGASNPHIISGIFSEQVTVLNVSLMIGLTCTFLATLGVLVSRARRRWPEGPSRRRLGLVALAFVGLLGARYTMDYVEVMAPPDITFALSSLGLAHNHLGRSKGRYRAVEHTPVPPLRPADDREGPGPNVLLLVQESMSRMRMSLYGHDVPTTPRLASWVQRDPDHVLVFRKAVSTSSNTGIAIPAMWTGLPPDATVPAYHEAPFAWHYARAAGYRTFLASSQTFTFANFLGYFTSERAAPPDFFFNPESAGLTVGTGGGIDDDLLVERILPQIEQGRRDGRPFFGIIQFNTTHHPFDTHPLQGPAFDTSTRLGRYDNEVAVVDRQVDLIVQRLEAAGELRRTVIVLTSDHGENLGIHEDHRTQSYYDTVVGVPFVIHMPAELAARRPDLAAQIRANLDGRVGNLDILPTLLDAIGVYRRPEIRHFTERMNGQSLFEPVSPDRVIAIQNNTPTRQWSNEGFGLVRGDEKFMFSEWRGPRFYDLAADPLEQHDIWPERRASARWVHDAIAANPNMSAIFQRHAYRWQ